MAQVQRHVGGVSAGALFLEVLVDIEFAHAHPAVDFTLAQALQQQLVAQFIAKTLGTDAIGREPRHHLFERKAVLASNVLRGLVDRIVVDLDPALARALQLRLLEDQPLQHFARQYIFGRQLPALARNGLGHARHAVAHFGIGHRLGIDHGHDVICRAHAGVARHGAGTAVQRL